jgi:hypothetical protein
VASAEEIPVDMTPDQFKKWGPGLWHVAPGGTWEIIREEGFKTAAQLQSVSVPAGDGEADTVVVETTQGSYVRKRRDPASYMGDEEAVNTWVSMLDSRVYLFANRIPMDKLLAKQLARDNGAQDILIISTQRLLDAVRPSIELSSQNSSAVARVPSAEKLAEMFLPLSRFPDKRPAEVTVLDGFDAKGIVIRAERHYADGHYEVLPV